MKTPNRFLLLVLAAVAVAGLAVAQQAPQIKTTKLSDNFYTIETGSGGTIGILVGPDGVFMVDTNFPQNAQAVSDAIKKVTTQPIRFIVNTHLHGDHTGGNEFFGKAGATLMSRDQLRYRMAHPAPGANGQPGTPAAAPALATITYDGPVTMHMNGEEIQLIPIRNAHTDGDTLIRFVRNNILMTGDFFRSIQFPNIDRTSGGSMNGMLDGLAFVIGQSGPDTRIVPGHGPIVNRDGVEKQRDILLAVRDKIAPMVAQGKTLEEVNAANPTAGITVDQPGTTAARFVGQIYAELQAMK